LMKFFSSFTAISMLLLETDSNTVVGYR